jgi:hypothetical protein
MKFAVIDHDGLPQGFYAEEIHGTIGSPDCIIPATAVQITDEQWQELVSNSGSRRLIDGTVVKYTRPVTIDDLVLYAKNVRWQKESGGINVGGVPIATDDRSKLMITGARIKADKKADWSTSWAGQDGETYQVTAPLMIAISDAVSDHVDRCFAVYATVKSAIEAGTITTNAQIDAAFAA